MDTAHHSQKLDPLFASGRPSTHQALQTQADIIKCALQLFNNSGASSVTTHQIAEQTGISSGNLYYHFKNKEEIIRAIFWRMELFSETTWAGRGPLNPKEGLVGFMRFFFGELQKYRFFFREFAILLRSDALLAKLWQLRYEQLFGAMRQAANLWVKSGILRPFRSPADVDAFIENFWILANFTGVHLENRSSKAKDSSTNLLIYFLYPYHTEKGRKVLDLYLTE